MAGDKTHEVLDEMKKAAIGFSDRFRNMDTRQTDLQNSVNNLQSSTAAIKRKQEDLKENIKELMSVAKREERHLEELTLQSMEPQKKNLKSDIAKVEEQKESVNKEFADVISAITHKKEVLKNMQTRANFYQQETSASISKIKTEYSLYSNLFNIKWDHTVPDNFIKGFVLKPTEKRVVPFKFDKTSHSQFFITNYLWEQISMGSSLDKSQPDSKC